MSSTRYMSHRGGGHVQMPSSSSSTSSSSRSISSSRTRSSTSPVLSNSSFGSLDYFASPFEGIGPPRNSPVTSPDSTIKYASFSDTPTMAWPVPHLGTQVRSPVSPTPSTASYSSDLHGVGLAALGVPPSPSSNATPPSTHTADFASPGPSPSRFKPTPDMRKKLAMHRRTVLFPEARVVNWARPFRAQGHAQQHVEDVSADLLPSPQFDLEDLCQEAFQMQPIDMALFGASTQRQRRLRNASPMLSPASTESSDGPLTPDATPPMSDHPEPQLTNDGAWQIGSEGKGLGIDKVQHGLHRLSWSEKSQSASPIITTPVEQGEVQEILLNDGIETPELESRTSFIATASILDGYTDEAPHTVTASTSTPTIVSDRHEGAVKESTSEGTMSSNPFEYSSLISSSSMASLDSVPNTVSEVQQMRQAAESLMSSLRLAQSTAIARAYSSQPDINDSSPPRRRVASASASSTRIRRKAVPVIDDELEESSSLSSGQSTPTIEQDLATARLPPSPPSPAPVRKGFYALRAAAQSVPTFMLSKHSSPPSPTTSASSTSDVSTQLHTPTTPTFPTSVEVKQVPFQIHHEPTSTDKSKNAGYGGYMTRSQTLALQEREKREKEGKEAKSRRGLARFFKS